MTIKCSVYIAVSVDGFIAKSDGDVEWLNNPDFALEEGADLGYSAFIKSVDVLVMGRKSYEKVLSFGIWPYDSTPVVVLSSQEVNIPEHLSDKVRVMNTPPDDVVALLASEGAQHFYIDGGVTIQGFLRAGLIDEITITTIPILLGNGIPLFGSLVDDVSLRHLETNSYESGLVQSRYSVVK